jgi:hypothetical protein
MIIIIIVISMTFIIITIGILYEIDEPQEHIVTSSGEHEQL